VVVRRVRRVVRVVSCAGVQAGLFSKDILARWKSCEKYILVDLWHQQERYDDTANVCALRNTRRVASRGTECVVLTGGGRGEGGQQ
jgi:hypothetical protein